MIDNDNSERELQNKKSIEQSSSSNKEPPFPNSANDRRRDEQENNEEDEFELVRQYKERFDPIRWERAMEQKRQLPRLIGEIQDPGPAILKELKHDEVGMFIGSKEVKVSSTKNPQERGSFGFIDVFAAIESVSSTIDGILVLRFDSKKLNYVVRESLRLFRWDEKTKRYRKMPNSSVSLYSDYVFSRITQAGTYAIVGVNGHPLILKTIKMICGLRPFMNMVSPSIANKIQTRICQVILCAPEILEVMKDPAISDEMYHQGGIEGYPIPRGELERLPPIGSHGPENLCEQCLGIECGFLPECEILDELVHGHGPVCVYAGWETVGPFDLSGCIKQVAVDPGNSNRLYAAADNGGVWVLSNINNYPSSTWRALTDQLENLQMKAIAIASSDNNVIYAANSLGYLYRSSDRGIAWARTSNTNHGIIRKILIHQSNPQTVFVVSSTGLRISTDSGTTWTSLRTGDILDAVLDPLDSSIVYIAQRHSGVLKSYTLGFGPWEMVLNWSRADTPVSSMIKIALGYMRADGTLQLDSNRTIAVKFGNEVFVNQRGGRDSGNDWISKGKRLTAGGGDGFGDWCHVIAVDPFDPNVILAGEQELSKTADGGDNWTRVASYYQPHEDQQSIDFDRNNSGIVYLANDGGVFRSTNHGSTWFVGGSTVADEIAAKRSLVSGLVTAEFYRIGVKYDHAVGNLFHSGIIGSRGLNSGSWEGVEGHAWEWAYVYADPKRLSRYYIFAGALFRLNFPKMRTEDFIPFGDFVPYTSGPGTSTAVGAIAIDMRPTSNIILVGVNNDIGAGYGYRLMMTTEGDREPSLDAGGNPVGLPTWTTEIDNGDDPLLSVMFAPNTPGKCYVMSSSGKVFGKEDVNNTAEAWVEKGRWNTAGVRQLAINPQDNNRLYAITSNRVARSEDGGVIWTDVGSGSLPTSEFNSIVTHPTDSRKLYLGADSGIYISQNDGNIWSPYDDGLPNAEILQIFWQGNYLYAVTHGRGLWRRSPCQ
jgi:photosystem II stability/assembly factor-like uncharacterized protein